MEHKAGNGEVETADFACTDKRLIKGNVNVRGWSREELLEPQGVAIGMEGSIPVSVCLYMDVPETLLDAVRFSGGSGMLRGLLGPY